MWFLSKSFNRIFNQQSFNKFIRSCCGVNSLNKINNEKNEAQRDPLI